MVERLKLIRKKLGLNQKTFCENLGISQVTYSTYETGRIKPRESVIKAICSVYNVNEVWLKTGEGEIFIDNAELKAFNKIVNKLSPQNQKYLLQLAETMLSQQDEEEAK